jgi:hypothetical protein
MYRSFLRAPGGAGANGRRSLQASMLSQIIEKRDIPITVTKIQLLGCIRDTMIFPLRVIVTHGYYNN